MDSSSQLDRVPVPLQVTIHLMEVIYKRRKSKSVFCVHIEQSYSPIKGASDPLIGFIYYNHEECAFTVRQNPNNKTYFGISPGIDMPSDFILKTMNLLVDKVQLN